jgi:hypothetical protein
MFPGVKRRAVVKSRALSRPPVHVTVPVVGSELELSRGQLFIMALALLALGYGGYDFLQQLHTMRQPSRSTRPSPTSA